jgi:hypothetical protein
MMARHTIEAAEKPLLDIFCDKYLFSIPSYQRPYAWTTEQAGELLSDVSGACGPTGKVDDLSPYFLGSIVLIKDPQSRDAEVVDGQQRLTTLTILLCVLRDLAEPTVAPHIHRYVCQIGNPVEGTADEFRLTPRSRDAEFFRKHIQSVGSTNSLPEPMNLPDARLRMIENAQHLRTTLEAMPSTERDRLIQFVAKQCYLVVVAASDQDSAFRIFSVLNSRGLDLSPADILKADIVGTVPDLEQDKFTAVWEDIEDELGRERFGELFAHIRTIHRKQKMRGNLISEFREYVPQARNNARAFITDELTPFATAYREITDKDFTSSKNAEAVNGRLTQLSRLDNFDWQPPAIYAVAKFRGDPDFLLKFFDALDRLAYGLFLTRGDPNDRATRYGKVLSALQDGSDLFAPSSPLQLTAEECKAIQKFLAGDVYQWTRIRLPILLRVDELLSAGGAKYDHKITTVEHVLPQNPTAASQWMKDFPAAETRLAWVHKLGNLVLLTQKKNSQASNLDFAEKKSKYFTSRKGVSAYALTSQVLAERVWTEATLKQRQTDILALLREHWRLGELVK